MEHDIRTGMSGSNRFCPSYKDSSPCTLCEGQRLTSSDGYQVAVPSSARTLTFKPGEGAFYISRPYRPLPN